MNWLLLKNSLLVGSFTTLLALGFGLMSALWLAGVETRGRNRFLGLAIMALALPPFLVSNCWLDLLGDAGTWRPWLPLNIMSLGGTVWILSLLLWPVSLLAVLSAWQRLEPAQLESDMAVQGWALIRGLLLPLARPSLVPAAVLTLVLALNNFAVPAILQVKVFPAEMWVRFNTAFDTVGALKLSWPLVAAPLFLLYWLSRRELPWPHPEATVPPRLFRQQLGGSWFWCCGVGSGLVGFLSLGLPLLQLATVHRTWTELPGALAAGQSALWSSFWLATISATVVIAISLIAATTSRRRHSQPAQRLCSSNRLLRLGLWLPFLLPGVLLGIGLIALFNHPWSAFLYQSVGIVILAFTIRYLAWGWNTAIHAVQSVDPHLVDIARLEGANRWQMFRHVHWPQIAPSMVAAWYIIFLLCLWDVESMILTVPPGGETLALRIFNLLHYGHNAQVNALCLSLLFLALIPLLLWNLWQLSRHHLSRLTHHALRSPLYALPLALLVTSCSPPPAFQSQFFSRVEIIGTRGVGVGQLNKPRSVALDAKDNLYVCDMTGRVQKFSADGAFLLSWQMPQTDKGRPKGMCRDRQGNIVLNEPHYSRVNHFSPEGKLLAQWGRQGTNAGEVGCPRAVAVNSHDEIYVSEYAQIERVQRFALAAKTNPSSPQASLPEPRTPGKEPGRGAAAPIFLNAFGQMGDKPGEFNRPEGLCVDAQDRLYVADSCNHRIQVFSREGKFLCAFGKAGKGKGELSYPYDICVDAQGRQYVCEFGNSRIQIFDANHNPIEIFGGPGVAPGQFNNPWGVALDSAGNLYVADSQNHRVQKFIRK